VKLLQALSKLILENKISCEVSTGLKLVSTCNEGRSFEQRFYPDINKKVSAALY